MSSNQRGIVASTHSARLRPVARQAGEASVVCSSSHRVATATASATARAAASSCTSLPSTVITCRRATSVARSRDPVGDSCAAMKVPSWARIAACVAGSRGSTPMLFITSASSGLSAASPSTFSSIAPRSEGSMPPRSGRPGKPPPTRRRNLRRSRQGSSRCRASRLRDGSGAARRGTRREPGPRRRSPGGRRARPAGRGRPAPRRSRRRARSPGTSPRTSSCRCRRRPVVAAVVVTASTVVGHACSSPTRTDLVPAVWPYIKTTTDRPGWFPRIPARRDGRDDAGVGAAAYDCGRDGHPCRDP